MRILLSILIVSIFICSCSFTNDELEDALIFSDKNRTELEKVLSHYSASKDDSLKYKAAIFLIKNMPYHYYPQSEDLDKYFDVISM